MKMMLRLVGGVPGTIRYPLFWTNKPRNRQESEQRWAALARQLPKMEDLLQLLKAPIEWEYVGIMKWQFIVDLPIKHGDFP